MDQGLSLHFFSDCIAQELQLGRAGFVPRAAEDVFHSIWQNKFLVEFLPVRVCHATEDALPTSGGLMTIFFNSQRLVVQPWRMMQAVA